MDYSFFLYNPLRRYYYYASYFEKPLRHHALQEEEPEPEQERDEHGARTAPEQPSLANTAF